MLLPPGASRTAPVGTIIAIYLSEFAPHKVREVIKPALELISAVPTIVFGYFALLFVTPLLQNLGIGTLLLMRMESMLELEGFGRVQLHTLADNVRAVSFYQRQGYRILALRPEERLSRNPDPGVRLEKQLSPWRGPVGAP